MPKIQKRVGIVLKIKKMKKLTVLLSLVAFSYMSNAQKIVKFEDDFDSRYLVDEPLIVKKDRSAIIVIPRINKEVGDDYDAIVIATYNERECVQNAELSIVFGNGERIADHRQAESLGKLHRHVFHGVDGQVSAVLQQGCFQLFDEQPLAADLGQRRVENLVATGREADQLHLEVGVQSLQLGFDVLRLPQGQFALTRGDRE